MQLKEVFRNARFTPGRWFYLWLCLSVYLSNLQAGDSILVTKNYKFQDGLYLDFDQWKTNTPEWTLDEVDLNYFLNPLNHTLKIASVSLGDTGKFISPDTLWGVALDGIPFIRVGQGQGLERTIPFSSIRVRGKISYFMYEEVISRKVPIAAYNPLNGIPFRSGEVEQKEVFWRERMIHWQTGEVRDFDKSNFLEWIADDPPLVRSVEELEGEEIAEKLFKCLLIYDDRNPVFIH